MSGGQHYFVGVSLETEGSKGERNEDGKKKTLKVNLVTISSNFLEELIMHLKIQGKVPGKEYVITFVIVPYCLVLFRKRNYISLCHTNTTYLIYSKCHDYIRLLVNDFSFASRVTQICLHLQKPRQRDASRFNISIKLTVQ